MSGFLFSLLERSVAPKPAFKPRRASIYEPDVTAAASELVDRADFVARVESRVQYRSTGPREHDRANSHSTAEGVGTGARDAPWHRPRAPVREVALLAPPERAESKGPALPPRPRLRRPPMTSEREVGAEKESRGLAYRPALLPLGEAMARTPATRGPTLDRDHAVARRVLPQDAMRLSTRNPIARETALRRVTPRPTRESTPATERRPEPPSARQASRPPPTALAPPPGAARRAIAESDSTAGSGTTIRVKIGRIEIKSSTAPTRSKVGPRSPAVSLGRYLERRKEEAR